MLFDSFDQVLDFIVQIRDKTHLAWSKHVGGGNSYKFALYAQSNAAQMCTTEVDMLKAALLSSEFSSCAAAACKDSMVALQ